MKRILVVDNQLSHRDLLDRFLTKKNFSITTASSFGQALEHIKAAKFEFIICEYRLPDGDGKTFFATCTQLACTAKFIFMTRDVNLRNAVELIRQGAYQFLAKPLNPDELLEILHTCDPSETSNIHHQGAPAKFLKATALPEGEAQIVYGHSSKAKWMIKQAEKVATTNFSVLIEGETGTGKESLARLIHQKSHRNAGPFVAVDCGSLSREIAGSELFGHEKGAFTGAMNSKTGFFEQANGGTIFLDEIANLSLDIQVSLLRALQEKTIRKIGGGKEISIDVRIIAATNEELMGKSQNMGFREDLLFRLNEFVLRLPALRERMEDLPQFIDFFLDQTSHELQQPKAVIGDGVMEYLTNYRWPGNIRELRNVIRRACLFVNKNNEISMDSLPHRVLVSHAYKADSTNGHTQPTQVNGNGLLQDHDPEDLKSTAIRAESQRIMEVLKDVQFNKTKAAEVLNIHRKTLYSKLKQMNIL